MINWSYFSEMLKNRRERAEEAAGLLKNQPIIRRWHEKANRDLRAAKAQQGPQGQGPQGQGPAPVFRPPNPNAPTAQPRPFILTQKPPPGQANNPAAAKWGVIAMPNIPLGRQWAQVYPPARQQAAAQPQPGGGGGAPNAAQPSGGQGPANPIARQQAAAQPPGGQGPANPIARQQAAAQPPGGQGPANPIATAAGKAAAQPANPFKPHPAYGGQPPLAAPLAGLSPNVRLEAKPGTYYGAPQAGSPFSVKQGVLPPRLNPQQFLANSIKVAAQPPGGQGPANPIATAAGKAAAQPANPFTPHPAYGNTPPIAHPQALIKGNPVVSPARLHANTGRWSNFTYGAKSNKEPGSP